MSPSTELVPITTGLSDRLTADGLPRRPSAASSNGRPKKENIRSKPRRGSATRCS